MTVVVPVAEVGEKEAVVVVVARAVVVIVVAGRVNVDAAVEVDGRVVVVKMVVVDDVDATVEVVAVVVVDDGGAVVIVWLAIRSGSQTYKKPTPGRPTLS